MEAPSFSHPATFLCLTPATPDGIYVFNEVVLFTEQHSDHPQIKHVRRFMDVQPFRHGTPAPTQLSIEAENLSQSATASDVSGSEEHDLQYKGSYKLSFNERPDLAQLGWGAGTGRWDLKTMTVVANGGVDIQLAPPGPRFSKYGVAGKHLYFYFDQTGSICVRIVNTRRPKVVLGNEEFDSGSRIIARKQFILIGKLLYDLEIITVDEENYQKNLRLFFTYYLKRDAPQPDLSATPSPWDLTFNNWIVKGTVGKGAFGSVHAAKHKLTGATAAAKLLVRSAKIWPRAAAEINILGLLPEHKRILKLCHVEYERGERWFTGPEDDEDERHAIAARPERIILIVQPFARFNMEELMDKIPDKMRLEAFFQILNGVNALHSKNFIHRDIKPANIGIVHFSPDTGIEIVILDYGQTVCASTCDPRQGSAGTPSYRAPEMEDQIYGPAVDVWACGVLGLQLFITNGALYWNKTVDKKDYIIQEVSLLERELSTSPNHLLSSLLTWDPSQRMSAKRALSHACFSILPLSGTGPGPMAAGAGLKHGRD